VACALRASLIILDLPGHNRVPAIAPRADLRVGARAAIATSAHKRRQVTAQCRSARPHPDQRSTIQPAPESAIRARPGTQNDVPEQWRHPSLATQIGTYLEPS
jgi:hypothetical protein